MLRSFALVVLLWLPTAVQAQTQNEISLEQCWDAGNHVCSAWGYYTHPPAGYSFLISFGLYDSYGNELYGGGGEDRGGWWQASLSGVQPGTYWAEAWIYIYKNGQYVSHYPSNIVEVTVQ